MAYPKDFKYTKEHEWIKPDGGTATVGITNYAQESLGDIVFVELPKVGAELSAGKTFGTVESTISLAALTYFSNSSGEMDKTAPMLSNPCPVSSAGNWMSVS